MPIYRTTKTLGSKRGIIRTGEVVRESHGRFRQGIKGGWILEESEYFKKVIPAPSPVESIKPVVKPVRFTKPPPVVKSPVSEKPIEEPPILEKPYDGGLLKEVDPPSEVEVVTAIKPEKPEEPEEPEAPTESPIESPMIDELDFIGNADETTLLDAGILSLSDLEGKTVEDLMRLRGIGYSKATKLLDARDEWLKKVSGI